MLYTEILSGVWIGDIDVMYNKKFLQDNHITVIINCTINFKFSDSPGIQNIRIPLSDNLWNNIELLRQHKDNILQFIDSHIDKHNILLCCYDGKTLSPFIMSLYLIHYGEITKDRVKQIILSKNPLVSMDWDTSLLDL